MGNSYQLELPFYGSATMPQNCALVPMSYYQNAEANLSSILTGASSAQASQTTVVAANVPMTHENFIKKWGWDPHKVADEAQNYMKKQEGIRNTLDDVRRQLNQPTNYAEVIENGIINKPGNGPNMAEIYRSTGVPANVKAPFAATDLTPVSELKNLKFDSEKYLVGKVDDLAAQNKRLQEQLNLFTQQHVDDIGKHLSQPTNYAEVIENGIINKPGNGLNMAEVYRSTGVPTNVKAPFAVTDLTPVSEFKNFKPDASVLEKTDDVVKAFDWKKFGKVALIAAGVLAVGAGIYALVKHCKNKNAEQEPTSNVTTPPTSENEIVGTPIPQDSTLVVPPILPDSTGVNPPQEPVKVVPEEPEKEKEVELKTEYVYKKGEGPWHIAERYLKDKYANEPEKFENLPKAQKEQMILSETLRIAKLNNYKLVKKEINGKTQTVPEPTVHPGDTVKVA